MSDRLREALEALADRGQPSDPDEFAARVLHESRRGPGRSRWLPAAAAAVVAVVIGAAVLRGGGSGGDRIVTSPLTPLVPAAWQRAHLPPDARGSLAAAAVKGSTVVVVGTTPYPGEAMGFVSNDRGATWQAAEGLAGADDPTVLGVVGVDGGFLAVGRSADDAAAWTSPDGRRWTRAGVPGEGTAEAVAAARGRVVSVGGRGEGPAAWYSDDEGRTWRAARIDGHTEHRSYATTVVATDDGFVMAGVEASRLGGAANAAVWTSADGSHWTRVAHDPQLFPADAPMLGVASDGDRVVGVGPKASAWSSPDGKAWTKEQSPARPVRAILRSVARLDDGTWLAVGATEDTERASAWTSTDGTTWVPLADPAFSGLPVGAATGTATGERLAVVVGVERSGEDAAPAVWVRR